MMGIPKLLSPGETADSLGVTVKLLGQWRWRRVGPAFCKIGHGVKYRESDIIAYIDAQLQTTAATAAKG